MRLHQRFDGVCFAVIPSNFIKKLGWRKGTRLLWVLNADCTLTVSRQSTTQQQPPKPEEEVPQQPPKPQESIQEPKQHTPNPFL